MLLPATLELIGPITWRLPRWLDARLPHINIEGSGARTLAPGGISLDGSARPEAAAESEPAPTKA